MTGRRPGARDGEEQTRQCAGPPKSARLSIPLATAFAAVSSSGVRASVGVSAACAERKGVFAIVAAIASDVDDYGSASRNTPRAAAATSSDARSS